MPPLDGKIILITGAGRVPARSLAQALASAGAHLALSDLTPQAVEETAAACRLSGAQASVHVAAPAKGMAARMLVDEVLERWDGLDALILMPTAAPNRTVLDLDEWDFLHSLEANLNGPFLLTQLVANWQRSEKRSGDVLVLLPPPGPQASSAHRAGLAGLRELAHGFGRELFPYSVRVFGLEYSSLALPVLAAAGAAAVDILTGHNPAVPGEILTIA
ncbi:MAG: SDR family NAD(P)-dependent oxidoreductase [Anaerolineae bacterium]|nr:SDR family NAD(P)-dependent oxidoreductase [Anaerolineae bacterium]